MTGRPSITEFLRARLDEDQQRADRMDHRNIDDGGYYSCPATRSEAWGDLPTDCDCNLEARRKRALAEVEAKRGVVDWCIEVIGDRDLSTYDQFGCLRDDVAVRRPPGLRPNVGAAGSYAMTGQPTLPPGNDHERDVLGDPAPWHRCEPRWGYFDEWPGPVTTWDSELAGET